MFDLLWFLVRYPFERIVRIILDTWSKTSLAWSKKRTRWAYRAVAWWKKEPTSRFRYAIATVATW